MDAVRRLLDLVRPTSAICLLLAVVAACGAPVTPAPPPSQAQATGLLETLAGYAVAHDFDALCALGSGNCESVLAELGEGSAPSAEPTVTGTRVIEPHQLDDDTWTLGGRVLEVCGTDGNGKPYRSEVLVFDQAGSLHAIEAVFWWGNRIADDGRVGAGIDPPLAGGC